MDLTKNPNCYVSKLAPELAKINNLVYSPGISFERMQDYVHRLVRQAKATPARARFINALYDDCFLKRDIANLCFNAVNKGQNYHPK